MLSGSSSAAGPPPDLAGDDEFRDSLVRGEETFACPVKRNE